MDSRILPFILILMLSCGKKDSPLAETVPERYRPTLHFSPQKNWTNDPNGLVYFNGEFHLFYQYNPYGDTWGHMSWGHAVSRDLLHWDHLPVALPEYVDPNGDSVMVFSGTAVVDKGNTSGLCEGDSCLVAIYTSHVHKRGQGLRQHQSLAYSNDDGRTWAYYEKNPVLDIGRRDFRDPKIFWYERQKKWVMIVVVPDLHTAQLYESRNLLSWSLMSEFGPAGDTARIWECPDLFEVPVDGTSETRWVLSLSGSHPQGPDFVGMQYFTGTFDGRTFTADDLKADYVDYGKDFYAGIVVNNYNASDGSAVMIGWVNNWAYANLIPTSPWRGAMSLPRSLSLAKTEEGYRLRHKLWQGIERLRGEPIEDFGLSMADLGEALDLEIGIRTTSLAGVKLFKTDREEVTVAFDATHGVVLLDRTQSGNTKFSPLFPSVEQAPAGVRGDSISLRIIIDGSIIEVFEKGGRATLVDNVFPLDRDGRIEPYAPDPASTVSIRGWSLRR
jgi:fructan beta-fructosidase